MNKIIPYDTTRIMLDSHLYFVKIFGCYVREANIPLDLGVFSAALLKRVPHPQMYLRFCRQQQTDFKPYAGVTDLWTAETVDKRCVFVTWFYEIGDLAVNVMFAAEGEKRDGLSGSWHPRLGTNRLLISSYP